MRRKFLDSFELRGDGLTSAAVWGAYGGKAERGSDTIRRCLWKSRRETTVACIRLVMVALGKSVSEFIWKRG